MNPTLLLRNASTQAPTPFSAAHKSYVQSLYRRYLKNSLDWCIRRDIWRDRAIEIRAEFERNRHIANPRELGRVLQQAEAELKLHGHPDPYKRESKKKVICTYPFILCSFYIDKFPPFLFMIAPLAEDGTKWCVTEYFLLLHDLN